MDWALKRSIFINWARDGSGSFFFRIAKGFVGLAVQSFKSSVDIDRIEVELGQNNHQKIQPDLKRFFGFVDSTRTKVLGATKFPSSASTTSSSSSSDSECNRNERRRMNTSTKKKNR